MSSSSAKGSSGAPGGAVGETAAARSRRGTAEFLPSFVALQRAVAEACSGQIEWQGKIAAAIGAALEFASNDPAAARVLTITARRERSSRGDREQEVIDYFSARLAELAPGRVRSAISTDAGLIESIAVTVRGHLLSGTETVLPALAADLAYLALMPYTGPAEAKRWADSLGSAGSVEVH